MRRLLRRRGGRGRRGCPRARRCISLDPSTLGEVLADVPRLAEAAGVPEAGEQLVGGGGRPDRRGARRPWPAPSRPRVAALEWLDPVFVGGHWVPQMIELAGGEDVLGLPGEKSRTAEWAEVEAVAPEVVVSMPCGYDTERAAARDARRRAAGSRGLGARVAAVDASAYFSRPGPRLVDGIELLATCCTPAGARAAGGAVQLA